jgi:hypothetical protein
MSKHLRRAPDIRLILALIICFGLLGSTFAQTQNATVNGRVLDSSGAVVPDATVTLVNSETQTQSKVQSTAEGNFTFAGVAPGRYKLSVDKSGFGKVEETLQLVVAQRLTRDVTLKAGGESTTVEVISDAAAINTSTAEVSTTVSGQQLQSLPLLTKNPYALIGLSGGAVDTASMTGDNRGAGFAINGQRTSSINYLLDGVENNETFATGNAVTVPNDAVQEFKVQASNNSAEFGRNAVVTNVVTKSGTNKFHGSASEFYRGAALTANTVQNKATDTDKPNFVRNDFTATVGGPIIKDRTFFFLSGEGVRIRSNGTRFFWTPTQAFFNATSPGMQQAITAAGGVPASDPNTCMTADDWASRNNLAAGTLTTASGGVLPGNTPLFCQSVVNVPVDAGGGAASNNWNATAKLDHRLSGRTNLSYRYAYTANNFPVGAGSVSPWPLFQTGATFKGQNHGLTLTHSFSNTLVSENKLGFSRSDPQAPLGAAPANIPCVQFNNLFGTPDGNGIALFGYLPTGCAAFALPSGGPQNTITANSGWTLSHGKHTYKWGAYMSSLRDNHTFGASQQATARITRPQNLINGIVDRSFSVAIDPRGHNAGDIYDPAVDGPYGSPNFTRHYHYNEFALYGEDSFRITNRLTVTAGLRWEYFGVLHSPNEEKFLDANFFLDATGVPKASNPSKTFIEQIRDGRFQRTGNLFNQDWNNFGPRLGFAYDVFGDGNTAVRGGYGMYYDKNFGNALFNAIQNFPNYAVITRNSTSAAPLSGPVTADQFQTMVNVIGSGPQALTGSARMLDRDLVTAYSQQWNAAIEHNWKGRGIVTSLTYVGTKGDKLYSLNNINQFGSCILAPPGALAVCDPAGAIDPTGNASRANQTGVTNLNRRGNEGYSRYHGVTGEMRVNNFKGLTILTNYTYSVSKDNSSSFFGDSAFEGFFGFGFKNPFDPGADYGYSANDIRHRYLLSYNYDIPVPSSWTGVARSVLGGWSLSGVYNAQTGGTFSVYDSNSNSLCAASGTNFCYPLVAGAAPKREQTIINDPTARNTYVLYDITNQYISQDTFCGTQPDIDVCYAQLANGILPPGAVYPKRNAYRMPGVWNWDMAVAKKVRLPWEGTGFEFRAEFFNVLNHSNLYANAGTNDIANTDPTGTRSIVTANYGQRPAVGASGVQADRRAIQLGAKFTF